MSLIKKRRFDDDEWTTTDDIGIVWKKLFESGKNKILSKEYNIAHR